MQLERKYFNESIGCEMRTTEEIQRKIQELEFSELYYKNLPPEDSRVYDDFQNWLMNEEIQKIRFQKGVLKTYLLRPMFLDDVNNWLNGE